MQELTRRIASAKSWGIEPVSLLTPAEVKELVPYIDEQLILGGFYTPGAGVVDSLRAGTIMRERAGRGGHDGRRPTPRCSGSTSSTAASGACAPRAATSRPTAS